MRRVVPEKLFSRQRRVEGEVEKEVLSTRRLGVVQVPHEVPREEALGASMLGYVNVHMCGYWERRGGNKRQDWKRKAES